MNGKEKRSRKDGDERAGGGDSDGVMDVSIRGLTAEDCCCARC